MFSPEKIVLSKKAGTVSILAFVAISFLTAATFGHGGEDHGDQKPVVTNVKGIVSHIKQLGEIELMLKHPELLPNTATAGRLFFTRFETNEPLDKVTAVIEIESEDGSVSQAPVEKTDEAGIFNVKIPALPQGTYVVRAKVSTKGETDTVTFAGVEVRSETTALAGSAETSWTRTAIIALIFAVLIAMSALLVYFASRFSDRKQIENEAVSA